MFPQWQGETQEFCPNAKVVLVGCKLDMRTDVNTLRELSKQRLIPVTHEQVRIADIWVENGEVASREEWKFPHNGCGWQGTTKHHNDYTQYFPSWISSGVAYLMRSHEKSERDRRLVPHKQPLQNQSREESLEGHSPASVFDSSFVDKCYKVADGERKEPRTGASCDLWDFLRKVKSMHICIFIHNKMQDKEDKRTLINEEALLRSAAMTFGPGGAGAGGVRRRRRG